MQTYKIHSIVQSAPAQFGKTRIVFKTNETGEKMISCFTKFPDSIKVGAEIQGDIKEVAKDDKIYYNFEFGGSKASSSPSAPASQHFEKVLDKLTGMTITLNEILGHVKPKPPRHEEPKF